MQMHEHNKVQKFNQDMKAVQQCRQQWHSSTMAVTQQTYKGQHNSTTWMQAQAGATSNQGQHTTESSAQHGSGSSMDTYTHTHECVCTQ